MKEGQGRTKAKTEEKKDTKKRGGGKKRGKREQGWQRK